MNGIIKKSFENAEDVAQFHYAIWVVTSGRSAVHTEDGSTEEFGPGDIGSTPPGHETWVVGDETVVGIDILAESLG